MTVCEHESIRFGYKRRSGYFVECLECGARGPERWSKVGAVGAFFDAARFGRLDVVAWIDEYAERELGGNDSCGRCSL